MWGSTFLARLIHSAQSVQMCDVHHCVEAGDEMSEFVELESYRKKLQSMPLDEVVNEYIRHFGRPPPGKPTSAAPLISEIIEELESARDPPTREG